MKRAVLLGALALVACGDDKTCGPDFPKGSYRVETRVLDDSGCGLDTFTTEVVEFGGSGAGSVEGAGFQWDCLPGQNEWATGCVEELASACDVFGPEGDYLFTADSQSVRTWEPGDDAFTELETRIISDANTGQTVCRVTLEREGTRLSP